MNVLGVMSRKAELSDIAEFVGEGAVSSDLRLHHHLPEGRA